VNKKNHRRRECFVCVLSLMLTLLPFTSARSQSLCESQGYVVGFFNGVWNQNTQADVGMALEQLRALGGTTFNDEPVKYETFYNHTGSSVGATFAQDIAETFIQRANEIDTSGSLARRFEFYWEVISIGDRSYLDRLISVIPTSADLINGVFDDLYQEIATRAAAEIASLISNPPTQSDLAEHNARLEELRVQGQKLVFFAHSQGNLFANAAFDFISPTVTPGSVAVVHVAPASPTLRGNYALADIDLVINALRVQGLASVPDVNLTLPLSVRDPSGHTLIQTYLDRSRPGRSFVKNLLDSALANLVTPFAEGNIGFFTVTLTWDGTGDVDLHAFEPNGAHVYYANPAGVSGFLDVDNVDANGPEHYFSTCDSTMLQTGTYAIGINNFALATGRTATVQASSFTQGVLATKSLDVGPETGNDGNNSPIPVMNVVVTMDPATGGFSVSAQ
jgi:hypothetical protein